MSSAASPSASHPSGTGWAPSLAVAFRYLLAARICSVFFMHISDCDETYNYWEPVSAKLNAAIKS